MTFRNVGSETDIGHAELRKLGQPVELDEALALEALRGGACVLPAAEFEAIGFTEDELRKYATPGAQIKAPPEFKDKLKAAWLAADKLRGEVTRG